MLRGFVLGALIGAPFVLLDVISSSADSQWTGTYPGLQFLGTAAWTLGSWASIGAFVGLFAPHLRGAHGLQKGAILAVAGLLPALWADLLWSNRSDWLTAGWFYLRYALFCLVLGVASVDLPAVLRAGLRLRDWPRVHNWRFALTWSSSALVLLSATVAAFLASTATELGKTAVTGLVKESGRAETTVSSTREGP
jgi:hypothetical protein